MSDKVLFKAPASVCSSNVASSWLCRRVPGRGSQSIRCRCCIEFHELDPLAATSSQQIIQTCDPSSWITPGSVWVCQNFSTTLITLVWKVCHSTLTCYFVFNPCRLLWSCSTCWYSVCQIFGVPLGNPIWSGTCIGLLWKNIIKGKTCNWRSKNFVSE